MFYRSGTFEFNDNTNRAYKMVISNHIVELYEFEDKPKTNPKHEKRYLSDEEKENKSKKFSRNRTATNVRRLAIMNFSDKATFMTLTFKDNVTDIEQANKEFKKFMQRLRRKEGDDFRYLAVIEFQKRGAVHYHVLTTIQYIDHADLAKIWRNGFVKINKVNHVDNIGAYIIKYMIKNVNDERLKGKKAYLTSKNLDRPIIVTDLKTIGQVVNVFNLEGLETVFDKSWFSEFMGQTVYREWNLKRNEENQ